MDRSVSIIVVCFNEENFIEAVLQNIQDQDYPKDLIEVFVVDGMSTDRTPKIIDDFIAKSNLKLTRLDNERKTVPFGLNIGIDRSTGDYIVRIDAHANYPLNYLSTLVSKAVELGSDNIGVVLRTVPGNDSAIAKTIAFAISHPFGIGNATFRTGSNEVQEVDTVPFGCFKRDVFERFGLFDEQLTRNQDDEFNARIIANGGMIHLLPAPVVTYHARSGLKSLARMYFQYGLFKPLVNRKLGSPATIRQFIPPLFVLMVFCGIIASLVCNCLWFLSPLLITLHLFAGLAVWATNASKLPFQAALLLPITLIIIHFSYGSGYLRGIIQFLIFRLDPPDSIKVSR